MNRAALLLLASLVGAPAMAAPIAPADYGMLHWRSIGPFRGGRVLAVSGASDDRLHFYFGSVNGGVWETRDAGRTWTPIFDGVQVGSIGALAVAPAWAETLNYKADLRGDTEVPPTDSKAVGHVTANYDTDSKKLSWHVGYTDLSGPATMAHFHGPARTGKNAPVMVPVSGAMGSPIDGSATLTDDQAKALANGDMYFNIHTDAHKAGEIRGQVEKGM